MLLTCNPRHCCHCHAALTLFITCPSSPSPLPSSLPTTVVVATIALVAVACPSPLSPLLLPSVLSLPSLTHHLCCHHANTQRGEGRTISIQWAIQLSANGASVAIVVTAVAFAVFASCTTGWDGLVQQHAGFQCPVDGVRQQGGAAVNICGAGIVLSTDQQR